MQHNISLDLILFNVSDLDFTWLRKQFEITRARRPTIGMECRDEELVVFRLRQLNVELRFECLNRRIEFVLFCCAEQFGL